MVVTENSDSNKKNVTATSYNLKENFTLIIFFFIVLIGLEWDSINVFTKMNFFSSKTHILAAFTQDIFMTFYLLTWTYFNDVNGGRNILINSQLKAYVRYFLSIFYFSPNDSPSKTTKNGFISSKKLF